MTETITTTIQFVKGESGEQIYDTSTGLAQTGDLLNFAVLAICFFVCLSGILFLNNYIRKTSLYEQCLGSGNIVRHKVIVVSGLVVLVILFASIVFGFTTYNAYASSNSNLVVKDVTQVRVYDDGTINADNLTFTNISENAFNISSVSMTATSEIDLSNVIWKLTSPDGRDLFNGTIYDVNTLDPEYSIPALTDIAAQFSVIMDLNMAKTLIGTSPVSFSFSVKEDVPEPVRIQLKNVDIGGGQIVNYCPVFQKNNVPKGVEFFNQDETKSYNEMNVDIDHAVVMGKATFNTVRSVSTEDHEFWNKIYSGPEEAGEAIALTDKYASKLLSDEKWNALKHDEGQSETTPPIIYGTSLLDIWNTYKDNGFGGSTVSGNNWGHFWSIDCFSSEKAWKWSCDDVKWTQGWRSKKAYLVGYNILFCREFTT